ncbi:MAG: UvrD-helicase domain-containing protein [Bdellovibrionaceae bacterium]|nr:UvrD-helicase domain-containing protein [Pseudobdellovibrionaceae bacterium]
MNLSEFLLKNLNPPQTDAVETMNGPLLILAGAGSGKTRVLTHRMAHIIGNGLAAADEILCVTFTNKAAKEMEHRIYKLLSEIQVPIMSHLWVNTFHAFCVRILRQHVEMLDYKKPFTIYDSGDQLSLIKRVLQALNLNDKMYPPKSFQGRISQSKMLGLLPENLKANNSRNIVDQKTLEVYTRYEIEMKKANAMDFDDLLLKTYELFRMYPDLLKAYQEKFKYIMVDEYQDTNHIQYLLIKMLGGSHQNLCVVGDEDQSIYSWRGAGITNILNFEKDFPNAKMIKLEENYRSTKNIVNAATSVIQNNTERKDKTLFTNNSDGDSIQIRLERTEYDEAKFVSKEIQRLISSGHNNLNDYAIFYRTNAQSRVLEEQLRALAIPYRLIGGMRFYERAEIKDMISYLRLSVNPSDNIAAKRIINVPARGIGKTTVEQLDHLSMERNITFFEAIKYAVDHKEFPAGTTSKLRRFADIIDDLIVQQNHYKLSDFYPLVLDKTEYLVMLKKENTPEAEARVSNLEELSNAIVQFEKERGDDASIAGYLEELALASDLDKQDAEYNAVTMMTLHISKGLEYPYVFIVGCEENLFPSTRADDTDESGIEEERRLAYVGMTRAREKLWMTHTQIRRVWGQEQMNLPSRFINEIPKNLINYSSGVASQSPSSFASRYGSRNQNQDNDSQNFPNYDDYSESYSGSTSSKSKSGYSKGQRVRHPTFGVGSIFDLEGADDDLKISVMFQDKTIKKFIAKYARLERV